MSKSLCLRFIPPARDAGDTEHEGATLFVGERRALDWGRLELGGGAVEPALDTGGRIVADTFLRGGSPVGARIGGGGIFPKS